MQIIQKYGSFGIYGNPQNPFRVVLQFVGDVPDDLTVKAYLGNNPAERTEVAPTLTDTERDDSVLLEVSQAKMALVAQYNTLSVEIKWGGIVQFRGPFRADRAASDLQNDEVIALRSAMGQTMYVYAEELLAQILGIQTDVTSKLADTEEFRNETEALRDEAEAFSQQTADDREATGADRIAIASDKQTVLNSTDLANQHKISAFNSSVAAGEFADDSEAAAALASTKAAEALASANAANGSAGTATSMATEASASAGAAAGSAGTAADQAAIAQENRFVWKGDWLPSTPYVIGDGVQAGGNSYRCKTPHTSGATFSATNWDVMAQGGSAADGSITAPKIANSAVNISKTSFFGTGKNLFNPLDADVLNNTFLYWNGSAAVTQPGAGNSESGFIPVTESTSYVFRTNSSYVLWYNAAKVAIGGQNNSNLVKTSPVGAAYMRFYYATASAGVMQVEQGSVATAYEAFYYVLKLADGTPIRIDSGSPALLAQVNAQIITNLPNKGIRYEKTSFLQPGKNLFNPLDPDITVGFVSDTSGNITSVAGYKTTGYVPISESTVYTISPRLLIAWYDKNKAFISGVAQGLTPVTFTSPTGAAYVRVSCTDFNFLKLQIEQNGSATGYEAFFLTLKTSSGNLPFATPLLTPGIIKELHTNFLYQGKNLFNPNDPDIITGKFVYHNGTSEVLQTNADYLVSGYIPVSASTAYTKTASDFLVWYDAFKTPISGLGQGAGKTVTSPSTAAYVRISVLIAVKNVYQLELGSTETGFEAYGFFNKYPYKDQTAPLKWASIGDSITAGGQWQAKVATALNLTHVNLGIGGTALAGGTSTTGGMWSDDRINAIPSDVDIISLLPCTNDWARSYALGTINSTNTNEVYGALNKWCERVSTNHPGKRIFLLTTTYGEMYGNVAPASANWPNAYTNAIGLTTRDYANAIKAIGDKWGFPVVDLSGRCGWNTVNIRTYIGDDGGLLHPNTAGINRMAKVVTQAFRDIL